MAGKIPRWESELWSYVSSGDGMRCPLYSHCQVRQKGGWCPDDNKKRLSLFLNERQFNLSNYDFIQSEAKGFCRPFQLVEMLTQRYLKMRGVHSPPAPTDIISLADEQRPVEIRLLPLKVYHGAIWRLREAWIIQLKDDATSASRRFTLFHEAFHILAHCRTTPVFRKRGTKEGSFNELLADHFAMCTLMPGEWVKEKWAEAKDLDRMAEIFDVPRSAMCIKLRQLGLI